MNSKYISLLKRKIFHLFFGLVIIWFYQYSSYYTLLFLAVLSIVGLFLLNKNFYKKSFWLKFFIKYFKGVNPNPERGAFLFILGIFLSLYLFDNSFAILLFVVGDFFSGVVGFFGKRKFFYSDKKSYLGFFSFFLSTFFLMTGYDFFSKVIVSLFLSLIESIPTSKVNDNFTLPFFSAILLKVI